MIDWAAHSFLFDTSAESWLSREPPPLEAIWWRDYQRTRTVHISSITVLERIRGYARLWQSANPTQQAKIERARLIYLQAPRRVLPVSPAVAVVAGEIIALLPDPPTPPKRSHRLSESKADRLARWRFDAIIAATAMVYRLPLLHNNPADFEAIRLSAETNANRFPQVGQLQLVRCAAVASLAMRPT